MARHGKIFSAGLLALLFVTIIASSGFCDEEKKGPQPKFFVRKKTVELGTFYEGQDLEYTFNVRNNGIGELHIISVRPG